MATVRKLDRYLMTEILGPLGLGFLVYTFILLLRFLFASAEMIIRRGLPVSIVGKLLLLTLPNIVVLTLPMSLLFGTLIAVGRLSSDSELIAMRASGVSLLTLYRPILLLSGVLTVLNALLMIYVLPWGNHSLQELRLEITTQTVSQQVEPRVFYEEWEGKVVYVFEVPPGGKRWKGVFLAESIPSSERNQITTADWGEILVDKAGERVVLRLYNAIQQKVDLYAPDRYEISRHRRLDLVLDDQFTTGQKAKISASKGIRELNLRELRDLERDPAVESEQRNLARVEIHKKFAIPVACMVFGLFALPLGINNRRGGKASGFALSIAHPDRLLHPAQQRRGGGPLRQDPGLAGDVGAEHPAGDARRLPPDPAQPRQEPAVDPHRPLDPGGCLGGIQALKGIRRERRRELRAERQRRRAERPKKQAEARIPRLVLHLPRLRIVFPNLLDRYVARLFGWVFLLVVLSGLALVIIFDLSENFDELLKNKVATGVLLELLQVPVAADVLRDRPDRDPGDDAADLQPAGADERDHRLQVAGDEPLPPRRCRRWSRLSWSSLFCGYLESAVLPASNEKVAKLKDRIHGRETARTYRRADRQWLFGQGRLHLQLHPLRPGAGEPAAAAGVRLRRSAPADPPALRRVGPLHRRRLGVQQRLGALVRGGRRHRLRAVQGAEDRPLSRDAGLLRARRSAPRSRCATASSRATSRS